MARPASKHNLARLLFHQNHKRTLRLGVEETQSTQKESEMIETERLILRP